MNDNNMIRSLYRTDDAAAGVIMQQYPPQWDMERVFQKAYQGYLAQKKEQLQMEMPFSSELTETVEYTTESRISRSIRRAGGYAGLAAAMIGVFLFVFKGASMRPPVDQIPDETIPPTTTASETEITTSTTEETIYETTAVSAFIPANTTAPETTASGTESTTVVTSTETAKMQTEAIVTASPASGTAMSCTTETSVTTTEMPTESTQATTTTETTTTVPPVIPQGHFEVSEQSGSFFQITYVREDASAVEEHTHSFAAEGFTLTNTSVRNPDYDYRSVIYNLEDAAGQSYMVLEYRYAYFMPSFNPESYPLTKSYTIGGKTVFLVYQEDPESLCHLMWDDGCHVCHITSQYKDLANMELLVLNQITN